MQSAGQLKRGDHEFSIETNIWWRFRAADFTIGRNETAYGGEHPLHTGHQSRIPADSQPLRASRARIGWSGE